MALTYNENYVQTIKKNNVSYQIKDAVAAAAIEIIQGNASTEGSIAKAKADAISTASSDATSKANSAETAAKNYADGLASNYDASGAAASAETAAKTYAKGLVDKVLGSDSSAQTITNLQNVLNELNDPNNAQGITGTFIDTVKADLSGLTKDNGSGGTTHATVKEYVDNAVSNASSDATAAIQALDATKTSSDGTNVQVKVTEVDGKITAVNITTDNSINATDLANKVGAIGNNVTVKQYVDSYIGNIQSSISNGVLTLGH